MGSVLSGAGEEGAVCVCVCVCVCVWRGYCMVATSGKLRSVIQWNIIFIQISLLSQILPKVTAVWGHHWAELRDDVRLPLPLYPLVSRSHLPRVPQGHLSTKICM